MVSPTYIVGTLIFLCAGVRNQYHLYYLDQTQSIGLYYDCLHYEVIDDANQHGVTESNVKNWRQIIPYCRRPFAQMEKVLNKRDEGNISSRLTFEELRKKNISTEDLLVWSASIDLIEDYDVYLHQPLNSSLRFLMFYNCSLPWFGTFCEYTFNTRQSFDRIVNRTFVDKIPQTMLNITCYIDLKCHRGPPPTCLDWREVCDGKIDCIGNDVDEIGCFQLDTNECEDKEFRCHNGQCIPEEFVNEGLHYPDCVDGTDEENRIATFRLTKRPSIRCFYDPAFWCEELDYIKRSRTFVCSDGQFTEESILHVSNSNARSVCDNGRDRLTKNALLSYIDQWDLSIDCWFLLQCTTVYYSELDCDELCDDDDDSRWGCFVNVTDRCDADWVRFPQRRILAGDVQLVYLTNKSIFFVEENLAMFPDYICYDVKKCSFLSSTSILSINGTTCRSTEELGLRTFVDIVNLVQACSIMSENASVDLDQVQASLFQCPGTNKYISKHRVLDGIHDCYQSADEVNIDACQWNDKYRFRCSSEDKCISPILVRNLVNDCRGGEDELSSIAKQIRFPNLCNGYVHMAPVFIDGMNETDETHCDDWPCDNLYTRCDGAWNCPNGADELKCTKRNCSPDAHECVSPSTRKIICLPIHRAGDGLVDCLGSTDEREHCRLIRPNTSKTRYRCWNETLCVYNLSPCFEDTCLFEESNECSSDVQNVFARLQDDVKLQIPHFNHFILERSISDQQPESVLLSTVNHPNWPLSDISRNERTIRCNRGILIYVGMQMARHCLCPPAYYGDRCEYQSQRVSLTLQLTRICATACMGIYGIVISLLDQDQIIHDHEQITYTTTYGCENKFFIYLLYSSRPKDLTKSYHVRIDAYNKVDLIYRVSWILPVQFPVLPVNRMAAHLIIPVHSMNSSRHCSMFCGHGQCQTYFNSQHRYFCRCHSGWSGGNCTIAHRCDCSSDSTCLGIVANQSICLCSLHKYGPRCRLQSRCDEYPCQNGGTCIAGDGQGSTRNTFVCLCPSDYSGRFCEIVQSKVHLSFHRMNIPRSLLVHFIAVRPKADPIGTTIPTKIPYDQDLAIVDVLTSFHMIIAQIADEYYLAYVNNNHPQSNLTRIQLEPEQRCSHIRELFVNTTLTSSPLLRRVKHYHLLCQNRPQLKCFHDQEQFLCLCNEERYANCLTFDFSTTYTCHGREYCQNNAQCYSDRPSCPYSIFCVCADCFYGSKCEYTTKGFGLSLDAILGYQIRPRLALHRQPAIVKISLAITIIMLVVGLINSTLSLMTFYRKHPFESGCRLYLLATSIVSLSTTILFAMKFFILILSQMSLIINLSILRFSCISVDVLLRLGPTIVEWLHASVAIDRALTVTMSNRYNKKASQRAVRWVIIGILLISVGSILHDPIHRQVIDDRAEERRWCLVQYSQSLQIYNSAVNIIHFSIPFMINLLTAIIIIFAAARRRRIARQQRTYRQHLNEQLHQHGHLILSSLILVTLGTPRLAISFMSGCMKSARNPTLYLIGYFISFIPPSMTFIVFVVPSKLYSKEFHTTTKRLRTIIGR